MKKTFPCGHVGKGQFCHRCRQRDEKYEAEREVKRAEKAAHEAATDVGVDLSGLPKHVALRAADMIKRLNAGTHYTAFRGKRLTEWDHSIISIPMGWSYRIMCRDIGRLRAPH